MQVHAGWPLGRDTRSSVTVASCAADFELVDNDGCLWISLRFLRDLRPPRRGEFVYLIDYEGHGCVGTVEGVEGWYVCVRPDWATWMGGPRPVEPQ